MALSRGQAPGFLQPHSASAALALSQGHLAGMDPAAAAAAVRASQQALGGSGVLRFGPHLLAARARKSLPGSGTAA